MAAKADAIPNSTVKPELDPPGDKGVDITATTFFTSVEAKPGEEAVSKAVNLITDKSTPKYCEFVFVVNNLSDFDLRRTETAGNNGNWPLGDVMKGRCVASVLDRPHMSVAVQYTASDDDKGTDGKKTIALAGSRPGMTFGKRIAIYTGKSAKHAWNHMPKGSDFNDKYGNRALVKEKKGGYVYEYHIVALSYEQITVDCGEYADKEAVDQLVSQSADDTKLPRFIVIVNNCSGFDLRRTAVVENAGVWPLNDIPKGKCAVTGFDHTKSVEFSAQYTAVDTADGDGSSEEVAAATAEGRRATKEKEKTIAFAGSWLSATFSTSKRALNISVGTSAQLAIENMSEGADVCDEKGNRAMIQEREGTSRVFIYEVRELAAGDDRMRIAVDQIVAKKKKMPTFVFVVLNATEYTLRRTAAEGGFSWPIGDVRGNECVAEGFDRTYVKPFSVEYTVKEENVKVTLAGKWPVMGKRGIGIFIGDDAKTALEKSSKEHMHLDGKNHVEIAKYCTGYIFKYTINEVRYNK